MAKVEKGAVVTEDTLRDFLHGMLLIRRFEEKVEERFRAGDLPGFLHVAIGQEAVAVGVCAAMEEDDVFASTHRAHGHTLAKGTPPEAVMAELYGKKEGCSHGFGGSMHLYDVARGNLGANAVVGGGIPAIVGAALAFKFRGEPRVGVAFFGDGATNIGTFYEALNLAQLWKVPALFVCENNRWAESTPASQQLAIEDLTKRAKAFGMESVRVYGQDVAEVYRQAVRAIERVREGIPIFFLCDTHRLHGHYIGDPQVYRPKEDIEDARSHDPLELLRPQLDLSDEEVDALEEEIREIVEGSVEFAKNGTDPDPEDALKYVYA
jgi:acetoin:2,6-dichlorophenolindophenol oxidoreductase subunit alpha